MKPTTRYALMFAGIYMLARLIFYIGGWQYDHHVYLVGANLFLLILCIYFGLRTAKIERGGAQSASFLMDIKTGMQGAAMYALLVAVFVYLYDSIIDTQYLQDNIDEWRANAERLLADPNTERVPGLTDAQIMEQQMQWPNKIFSPWFHAVGTMVGLILGGTIYTVFIVVLQRKVLSRIS